MTTASIDDKGVVKYDVTTASITAGTDGTITGPATDGVATAKNVADAINAAKKHLKQKSLLTLVKVPMQRQVM